MATKKKILFIMTALNGGGAENVLTTLLSKICYDHYDVELLLTFFEGFYLKRLPKQVVIKTIYGKSRFLRRLLIFIYRKTGNSYVLKRILNKICIEKYDTIISFMEGEPLLYHSLISNRSTNNISWVHIDLMKNYWSKKYFYKSDENRIYNTMNRIVFVSNHAKDAFNQLFQINTFVVQTVIYNIVDAQLIIKKGNEKYDCDKRKFTICASGRLEQQKAFHRLIEVAKIIKEKGLDIDVYILGNGSLYEQLYKQIISNKLEDTVHLLGFCENPYVIMKNADMFVSTSITEGFPIVICEALILGLPIVATRVTGSIELLDNGLYGVLVEETIDDLVKNVEAMMLDRNRQKKYADLSIIRAKQLFDVDKQMKEIYAIL